MDDLKIVELFFERDEEALKQTEQKYGRYCHYIANNILESENDSEECVNDTYLRVWNAIPPAKPTNLKAFIGTVVRNLALDRYDKKRAKKRSDALELVFDELSECIPDGGGDDKLVEEMALKKALNDFLGSLEKNKRIIFMQRYWYLSSVKDIAARAGLSENNVKITLLRLRARFKKYLEKEGIVI